MIFVAWAFTSFTSGGVSTGSIRQCWIIPRMQVCARQIPFFVRARLVVHIQRIETTFLKMVSILLTLGRMRHRGIDMPRKCFAR